MTETETANLIDFSAEDLIQIQTPPQSSADPQTPTDLVPSGTNTFKSASAMLEKEDSLDNNPFDIAQKMACRPADPFDMVEKEACQKARLMLAPVEVKEGKLLSLSSDSFPNDSVEYILKDVQKPSSELDTAKALDVTSCNKVGGEETPTSTQNKSTPDSQTGLDSASSTESPSSAKTKKAVEHRKRLLKLSLSNSTFNSPVSRYTPTANEGFADENSTVSMILSEAAQMGEHLIAQESPLKLVDDDLISVDPNWNDSQQDFDDDLEMLKVKIPEVRDTISKTAGDPLAPKELFVESKSKQDNVEPKQTAPLTDLAAIRAKLKVKRDLSNNNQDISLLIESLKHLITDIDVHDKNKKEQATSLLDALSSALVSDKIATKTPQTEVQPSASSPRPQTIVRQKTFDIQLEEKQEPLHAAATTSPNSVPLGPCFDMPDIMIKSAATYDGETAEDKQDLHLPEIQVEPASPPPAETPQLDVNDIVEQLGKILEQHQFNNIHTTEKGVDGSAHTTTINPTFIVVMNTPQTTLTSPMNKAHQRRSDADNSFNEGSSPDFIKTLDTAMRRRSQSLSIHDKIKVVQLPLKQSNALPVSTEAPQTTYVDISPSAKGSFDKKANEFKTPSRTMRRNSFSNVTPCSSKYSNYRSIAQRRASGISNMQKPSSSVLATHHEQGERKNSSTIASAIVCPMQHLNLNTQLTNKRIKSSISTDSILKSSAPMKATIPVKKVAPMIKTPPSNCITTVNKAKSSTSTSVDTSMELLADGKPSRITSTNTPMTLPHLAGVLDVSSGFPNACSTPTVRTTPSKRSTFGPIAKSRYSYLPPTPSNNPSTHSTAAATARRRTINDFKAKSPIKPRLSPIGGPESTATVSHISTVNSIKGTIKKPQTASRTVNKLAPTVCGKTSTRLSTRASFGGTAATRRNKENKYP